MINAIIIDDEFYFRQSLISTFPWEEYNIHICAEASNGNDALELLEQFLPEIALVDINMPGINGLAFIKEGKIRSPHTRYIIISGYSEFSYAQKAVELGVFKYLLKPLRHEELKKTLQSAINKISADTKDANHLLDLHAKNTKYLSVLQRQFLSQLIVHGSKRLQKTISENCEFLQLSWDKQNYFYTVLLGTTTQTASNNFVDPDFQKIRILNLLNDEYQLPYNGLACETPDGLIEMLFSTKSMANPQEMFAELKKLQIYLENTFKQKYHFAVSAPSSSLDELPHISSQSYEIFTRYRLGADPSIVFYDKVYAKIISTLPKTTPIVAAIRAFQKSELEQLIKELEITLKNQTLSEKQLISSYILFLRDFLIIAREWHSELLEKSILLEIQQTSNGLYLDQYLKKLTNWINLLLKIVGNNRTSHYTLVVENTINYIKENYHQPNLSVELLSHQFHLNYAYLCSVFKRETNITINKYIKQYRLEKARTLLETSTDNIAEISECTGFQNTNYFSKCFKKEYGISPSDYIESFRKKNI